MSNPNTYDDKVVTGSKLSYFWKKLKTVFARKATTLAGYGITDAYTKEEADKRACIVDVDSLPTKNIRTNIFYRLRTYDEGEPAYTLMNGEKNCWYGDPIITVITVKNLPEVGESSTRDRTVIYYCESDKQSYFYGFTSGETWAEVSQVLGDVYKGVIKSPDQAVGADVLYMVAGIAPHHDYELYYYSDGKWSTLNIPDSEGAAKGMIIDYETATVSDVMDACELIADGGLVYIRKLINDNTMSMLMNVTSCGSMDSPISYRMLTASTTFADVSVMTIALTVIDGVLEKNCTQTSLTDKFVTSEKFEKAMASLPTGGGIVDVDTLPTENIDTKALYRLHVVEKTPGSAYVIIPGVETGSLEGIPTNVIIVDELPAVDDPNTKPMVEEIIDWGDGSTGAPNYNVYYSIIDNDVFMCITDAIKDLAGMDVGWYPVSIMFGVDVIVVTNEAEATEVGQLYLVYTEGEVIDEYVLYHYTTQWQEAGGGVSESELDEIIALQESYINGDAS